MKTAKRILTVVLCFIMLATSLYNEGWSALLQSIKASAMAGHEQRYDDTRIELNFNKNWSFGFTDDDAAYLKGFDDSSWEKVDLPHDFSMSQEFTATGDGVEAENGQLPGGTGWYRKWFNLYEYYTGDRVFLNFDGAYQHTYVYVNGQYVGENHYGYNSFSFEISDYLVSSNTVLNLIAVKVVNELPSSRWYSGSGINRDVRLTIAGPVHVALYGPRLTTPNIRNDITDGTVDAKIKLHNDTAISKKVTVETSILDNNHNLVSETVVSSQITVPANTEKEITLKPKVDNPKLWTLDDPQLYMLCTHVRNEKGELIDEYHTTFGYRYIDWDADRGFCFNGEYIKLKGVCMHHDQGALGAAQEYEAIYRQIVMLKEMGCNAIRTSHNSASSIVLDICNQIGMLVIEEFFDGWDASKNYNQHDFSEYFNETIDSSNTAIGAKGQKWYQYVVEHTILRDEHDPCIIAWDVGNELCNITDTESTENYEAIAQSIVNIVDKLDPSRPVLQGNNQPGNSVLAMIDSKMDVIGGNYSPEYWAAIMNDENDPRSSKPFVAIEAASAINSRGVYDTMSYYDFQCTSYDTNAVSWGNEAAEAWYYVVTNDWFSGEFIWTGFDYIGEPTPWNDGGHSNDNAIPNSSYFGVIDTAGFAKDSYYLYRSWWNEESTTLHLVPGSWNSENLLLNNGYANVAVYSNASKIELLLNGSVIATATSDVVTTPAGYTYRTWTEHIADSSKCAVGNFYTGNGADFYPQFSVKYAAGTLSVKAYDENNNEITDTVGSTKSVTGTATQIAAATWQNKDTFVADGTDYIYVEYEARDADGNFMNDYNGTLDVQVDDASARYAKIVGVDNGNAATTEKYQQPSVLISDSQARIQMFNGKALVILRSTEEEGTVNITATATDGATSFSTQGITVTTERETGIKLTDELDEVITQNPNKYVPTLYDEYEIVKYHIDRLEEPEYVPGSGSGSTGSGSTGSGSTGPSKYEIYLADSTVTEGSVADGEYVIYNQGFVMSDTLYYGYAVNGDYQFTNAVSSAGSAYQYESFMTTANNVFEFTHIGSNLYYILNKSLNQYVNMGSYTITYNSTPQALTVTAKSDGSIIISNFGYYAVHYYNTSYYYAEYKDYIPNVNESAHAALWLYSASEDSSDVPSVPEQNADGRWQINPVDSSAAQYVPDGDYVINIGGYILSDEIYDGWAIKSDGSFTDIDYAAAGSGYNYDSFKTTEDNVLTFIHQGGNKYYIKNKSTGLYLYDNVTADNIHQLLYGTTPQAFVVLANGDGSVRIYSDLNYSTFFIYNGQWGCFELLTTISDYSKIWLYSEVEQAPSNTEFNRYFANGSSDVPVADGEYALCNFNSDVSRLLTGNATTYGSITGLTYFDTSSEVSADASKISSVADDYIFIFTRQANGKYYVQHKTSGKYITINGGNNLTLEANPSAVNIAVNGDGDIGLYNDNGDFIDFFISNGQLFSIWNPGSIDATGNRALRLYSRTAQSDGNGGNSGGNTDSSGSHEKLELYNALHAGIEVDTSIYTRASFETLLRALEAGVNVFNDENSTSADYAAATAAINAAIEALEIDIKKIEGTLFKYGYNNSTGTSDYSDGGILMNNIAVRQMKQAILSDMNLVNQIKEIIDYDGVNTVWAEGRADEVLEGVAEAYARIYTLQFTGVAVNGSSVSNSASNFSSLESCTWPTVSLWNLWTKDNTHGANDPGTIHDGASVQGLASSTLQNGVVTSHSAYTDALSYANDGPNDSHDVTMYTYGFEPAPNSYKSVNLEYLSGISVYFPDLFTRESLDADGNATEATQGQFSKYYWDAEFPIFISTDEYGVNTYHFDSKDTTYLVQADFNDAEHTVDMELTEVGSWSANGSNSGSGFFPFNYKQGTTTYTGENAIYHYGFTFEHNFYIPKGGKHINGDDVIFNFSGDDDVYVYIDGVLVLDNGGLHGAREVTINFTECTINYQYVMDVTDGVLKGDEYEVTYSYNKIVEEHEDAAGYSADTIAALNKLHEVINDGQVHTLNFFYLERGASDSNCRMSFNLSETSEEVRIIDQVLTLDYALPVEYNINDNNNLSQAAVDNGVTVEYLGICAVNEEVNSTYTFELPQIIVPFEDGVTYTVEGMKYGTCTIDNEGNTSYTLESMHMSEAEHFYVCARITGDPTYAEDVVYYQIERTTFVPATAIYYEDTYNTITYTNGKVPSNYDNTENQYGIWQTEGMQSTTLKQTADLTDSEANPYGYETNYMSFSRYSGGSSHYVDVSTKNNPSSKYSGGSGAAWPTVDFTFTGTGFDLISVTDSTTGAFSVVVKDADGKTVRSTVVDTFYGYNYGRIYSDANGRPTLDSSLTPMYRSEDGTCTSSVRYYDENGAITNVAHYYNADGDVVETVTDTPAYAYAYGWVVAESGTTDTLYQIPVIKITDLEYGSYSVTITPTFTSAFGHASTADDGTKYYSIYLDAIKIYSPAGEGDNVADAEVKNAYTTDDELYPSYLELKNMLVGADSLSETDTQGIIFIDGIAALDNDIGTYMNAGPNNELYLAKDQAVAFEIWATSVPTDIQIGAKLACGNPDLTVSYESKTTDIDISTATDIYYSFNSVLPNDGKLTWRQIEGSDGNYYYTTGTVVIQNTGDEGSVLSVTNLKWTFSQTGGKGYFRIPTPVENEVVTLSVIEDTPAAAYSLMRMRTAALDVEQTQEPDVVTDSQGNSIVTIKFNTSADVASLVVTDGNGNPIDPQKIEYIASSGEDENVIGWTVNITTDGNGTYTYIVAGAYENGYTDLSKAVTVTVVVENTSADDGTDNDDSGSDGNTAGGTIFEALAGIYRKIIEFFRAVFALFGIIL